MRFEVVEHGDEWIVRQRGLELGRYTDQAKALKAVADCLRGADASAPASLAMRYGPRAA